MRRKNEAIRYNQFLPYANALFSNSLEAVLCVPVAFPVNSTLCAVRAGGSQYRANLSRFHRARRDPERCVCDAAAACLLVHPAELAGGGGCHHPPYDPFPDVWSPL